MNIVAPPQTEADQVATAFSTGPISQRAPIVQLPEEVLVFIIDALKQHAKTCLARTCQYLRKQVEPRLYRHLCDSRDPPKHMYWDHVGLFDTLMARPDLIKHVHSYEGPFTPPEWMNKDQVQLLKRRLVTTKLRQESSPDDSLTLAESIELSTTVFSQATNIRDVHFAHICSPSETGLWEPVSRALFDKRLERLVVNWIGQPVPLASLLRTQTELKALEIASNATEWQDLEEAHIPKLERLKCTAAQAASLVPGRPVTVLELIKEDDERVLGEDLFHRLALSAHPIVTLTITLPDLATHGIFQRTLQNISQYLPRVEDLTIRVNGYISGNVLLQEIHPFKHLVRLDLQETWLFEPMIPDNTVSSNGRRRFPDLEDWAVLTSNAKELCPTLVELKFRIMSRPGCWEYILY
ncbi:hypothetical protein FRC00_003755 [Tulasnella sp. 408]|nr:hypothetical protein FRC00_003755 [Tulasnella sp. 408]